MAINVNDKANSISDIESSISAEYQNSEFKNSLINTIYQLYLGFLSFLRGKSRFTNIYLPFAYLEKVKRQNENYTLKIIFFDDVPLLLLAFSWSTANFFWHSVSIVFLVISFWCIYELGYYENDYVAEKYESKPKLCLAYYNHKQMMQTAYPWVWSLLFGIAGIILLEQVRVSNLLDTSLSIEGNIGWLNLIILPYLSWITFLICMRCCFFIYNYFNKKTRAWLYILLQSFRYYGFLLVAATNLIGITLLSSIIISRSVLYIVYRYSGGNSKNWPRDIPEKFLRFSLFIFMLTSICLGSQSWELWQSWQTWAIIAWCLIQGQRQVRRVLSQVRLVVQDGSN